MEKTLFINACVRKNSRTKRLADAYLAKRGKPFSEVRLEDIDFPDVDEAFLEKRGKLIARGEFGDPLFALARQFAAAREIVIAAPFWDMSFPSALKRYLEQICAVGVTFRYTPDGAPKGLCRAEKLTYITTAGGDFAPDEYGFGCVKALARDFFGINDVGLIKVTGLDIDGADPEKILSDAINGL